MTILGGTSLDTTPTTAHGTIPSNRHLHGGRDGCMFCVGGTYDPENNLEGDGAAFAEHLALSDDCRDQWSIWRESIKDEWQGD